MHTLRLVTPFRLLMTGLMAVTLVAGAQALHARSAQADACLDNNTMLNCNTGFYYQQFEAHGRNVYQNGVPGNVNDAESFIALVGYKMLCTSPNPGGYIPAPLYNTQEATGSAFIVMTMLGYRPQPGNLGYKNVACGEFSRWAGLVRDYQAAGLINWNNNTLWIGNTYYQPTPSDVAYIAPGPEFQGTDPLITFFKKGRWAYSIRRQCANPVGRLTSIVPLNSPVIGAGASAGCDGNITGYVRDDDSFRAVAVRAIFYDNAGRSATSGTFYSAPQSNGNTGVNYPYTIPANQKPDWVVNGINPWRVIIQGADIPYGNWVEIGNVPVAACVVPAPACGTGTIEGENGALDPNTRFRMTGTINFTNNRPGVFRSPAQVVHSVRIYAGSTPFIRSYSPTNVTTNYPTTLDGEDGTGTMRMRTGWVGPTNQTGTFGMFWGLQGGRVPIICPQNPVPGQPGGGGTPFDVVDRPYFQIKGGDVSAGGGMGASGSAGSVPAAGDCTAAAGGTDPNTKAGLVSWNRGAAGAYAGAGTNYAALALGYIQGVATAQGSTTGQAPNGLTFANGRPTGATTTPTWAGGTDEHYGGSFGNATCIPNYFDYSKLTTFVGTAYRANPGGPLNITTANQTPTIYIDGDAVIDNNIIFSASGGYANIAAIPRYSLVVKGNIYISPNVDRIDGVLVAQPRTGVVNSGRIFTCWPTGASVATILNANLYNSCKQKPLVVNGAVVAKQIWLLRTYGTLTPGAAGPRVAETFNFTPEAWLNAPFTSDMTGKSDNYDAISSLPPVL